MCCCCTTARCRAEPRGSDSPCWLPPSSGSSPCLLSHTESLLPTAPRPYSPPHCSSSLLPSLPLQLLQKDPSKRLGHGPTGTADIKAHRYAGTVAAQHWLWLMPSSRHPPSSSTKPSSLPWDAAPHAHATVGRRCFTQLACSDASRTTILKWQCQWHHAS